MIFDLAFIQYQFVLKKFVKPLSDNPKTKVEDLVQALFFARWCNRDHTLNEINPNLLSDPSALKQGYINQICYHKE